MKAQGMGMSRFDTRLTKEQKAYFEQAAVLGGYRTLTDFVISSAQQQATTIIEKHQTILTSKRDQQIFFKAIMLPAKPNEKLKKAAARFNKLAAQK
jgi:uncharacterized protein (DUF1778 family)